MRKQWFDNIEEDCLEMGLALIEEGQTCWRQKQLEICCVQELACRCRRQVNRQCTVEADPPFSEFCLRLFLRLSDVMFNKPCMASIFILLHGWPVSGGGACQ